MKKHGITLIEILIAIAMLAILLAVAGNVVSYARRETQRGYWLQQAVVQLRTGTRLVADSLKKTSYPSTIVEKKKGNKVVKDTFSFKELRRYDSAGRLRGVTVNENECFDMHTVGARSVTPYFEDIDIMYFPVCEPEVDKLTGTDIPGKIRWFQLILKPSPHYKQSGLGDLYIVERDEEYDTAGLPNRAFSLKGEFSEKHKLVQNRKIISDVSNVSLEKFEILEERGTTVSESGAVAKITRKRVLFSLGVTVSHPTFEHLSLSDKCAIVNNVLVTEMPETPYLEILSMSADSVKLKYGEQIKDLKKEGVIANYQVMSIGEPANAIRVKNLKTNTEGYVHMRKESRS